MAVKLLTESFYLPPIEYFCALTEADELIIEREENIVKQTFRNRCQILGPNKVQSLIIPVDHSIKNMGEVQIKYSEKWHLEHWRSLEAAYNKSAYMFYYKEELEEIYFSKTARLIDFNTKLLSFCLDKLSISVPIKFTERYVPEISDKEMLDLRGTIHPKKVYTDRHIYKPMKYFQQFGKAFVPNLSIIDLLMAMGPEAKTVILQSKKVMNEH